MRSFVVAILAFASCVTVASADPCEAPLPAKGTTFSGVVTYIVDGDGLCVGQDQGGIEVRLADFNANELKERGGNEAKDTLRRIAFGKRVECVAGKKSYDRTVAACTLNGEPVGNLMRAAGVPEGGN